MLIVSKHKDYYDGVAGTTGVDKTIVFERKTEQFNDWDKFPNPFQKSGWRERIKLSQNFSYRSKSDKYDDACHFIIGFCGKLYLGFRMEYKNPEQRYLNDKLIDITYDVDFFLNHFNPYWTFTDFNEFVGLVNKYDTVDIHRELNTPIFVFDTNPMMKYRSDVWFIINPTLKDYQFYKIFDTFTAFQEIQMYISGVLGIGENPTVEVSDKDKIISRGFDYKWSFRKEPKEKK